MNTSSRQQRTSSVSITERIKKSSEKSSEKKPVYVTEEMEAQWRKEGKTELLRQPLYKQPKENNE